MNIIPGLLQHSSRKWLVSLALDVFEYSYTLSLISGKRKMVILYCLMGSQPVRFNELKRYLGKISDKTLPQNLKELEGDELVRRKVYPQIPPKVKHSLPNQNRQ